MRAARNQRFHQAATVHRLADDWRDGFQITRHLPRLQSGDEAVILRHAPQVVIVIAGDIDDIAAENLAPVLGEEGVDQLEETLGHIAERRQPEIERIAEQDELRLFAIGQRFAQAVSERQQHLARPIGDFAAAMEMCQQAVARTEVEVRQDDLGNAHAMVSRQV